MPDIKKSIMTHIVLGYPDFRTNKELIKVMSDAGVSFIEMQIPFSDPIADGPTILNANQQSLKNGVSVAGCFNFAEEMTGTFKNINFLFMSYYNIIFNAGVESFVKRSKKAGLYGLIVPDIPYEEDTEDFFPACRQYNINPIYVISPSTEEKRLKKISTISSGFVYCTSRIGITGAEKDPNKKLREYINKARTIIDLPIAVGFGIDSPGKAAMIAEFSDIIIIGSKIINIINESGNDFQKKVYNFLSEIKKAINAGNR